MPHRLVGAANNRYKYHDYSVVNEI